MKRTLCLKLKHGICEKNPLHKVEAQYMHELGMPSTENDCKNLGFTSREQNLSSQKESANCHSIYHDQ